MLLLKLNKSGPINKSRENVRYFCLVICHFNSAVIFKIINKLKINNNNFKFDINFKRHYN